LKGSKHFIWEMDVYPDVAEALGVLRPTSWMTRALGWLFDMSRKRAHGILALGDCMAARIKDRGISKSRIHITENWADGDAIRPCPFRADGKLSLLYSGNLGLVHELNTVTAAMLQMREEAASNSFLQAADGCAVVWKLFVPTKVCNMSFLRTTVRARSWLKG
jgi:hypothetical protein